MLDLAKVQCADFAACVNQDFAIVTSAGPLVSQLVEARPFGPRPGGALPWLQACRTPPVRGEGAAHLRVRPATGGHLVQA